MNDTLIPQLIRTFEISYGQISRASAAAGGPGSVGRLSKSTIFRIATGRLNASPEQQYLFSSALIQCVQAKIQSGRSFPLQRAEISALEVSPSQAERVG